MITASPVDASRNVENVASTWTTGSLWYANPLVRNLIHPGGCIVLELRSGRFQSLNGVGAAIWEIVQSSRHGISIGEIGEALNRRVHLDSHISSFVAQLSERQLIAHCPYPIPPSPALETTGRSDIRTLPAQSALHSESDRQRPALRAKAYLTLFRCGRMLRRKGYFALRSRFLAHQVLHPVIEPFPAKLWHYREAVNWAVKHFPYPPLCLECSAALAILLRNEGMKASVVIGCEPLPFYSHAWVEYASFVVNDSAAVHKKFGVIDRWL